MKPFVLVLLSGAAIAITVYSATTQGAVTSGTKEALKKHPNYTDGYGSQIHLAASNISRDPTDSVVHLRGDVRIEMWLAAKPTIHQFVVLRADRVEYNEKTGELDPDGNVRVTVAEAK